MLYSISDDCYSIFLFFSEGDGRLITRDEKGQLSDRWSGGVLKRFMSGIYSILPSSFDVRARELAWSPEVTTDSLDKPGGTDFNQQMSESPKDKLEELFRMQQSLNARIGVHTEAMSEEEQTKWLLNYTRAMNQEMAELIDSVPWKWWAKYQKFDAQNARVEVVDLFHFLISMAQVLGMSAEDVFNAYVKKNEVNFKRQDTGYAVKDEADSKHI